MSSAELEVYLQELHAELKQMNRNYFMHAHPNCYHLLNREILGVTTLLRNGSMLDQVPLLHSATAALATATSSVANLEKISLHDERHLQELHAELEHLPAGFYMHKLPNCYRLLNQEIFRRTTFLRNASTLDQTGLGRANVNIWASPCQSKISGLMPSSSAQNFPIFRGRSSGCIVKKTFRVDIPVDQYPNFDFVGNLLGHRDRGDIFQRIEATTKGRVFIRGRGSEKDPVKKEEMMKCRPGYEHLDEPLHILVTAQLPVETIDARLGQARKILEDFLKHMTSGLMQSSSAQNIRGSRGRSSGRLVKNRLKVFLPINLFPDFDFVEYLRTKWDALKRIQKSTGCRILIRGRGSMEDPVEEERLRSETGYEHLNEDLHVVVFAKDVPVEIINARMNQARDMIKDLIKPTYRSEDKKLQ